MREFWRSWFEVKSNWLIVASWPFFGLAIGLLVTEPKHHVDLVPYGVAESIGLALVGAGGLVALIQWRRTRGEERAAHEEYIQALAAMSGTEGFPLGTSPLDKTISATPRAEAIVGYRLWNRTAEGLLAPVGVAAEPWSDGENVAVVAPSNIEQPGFWALRSLEAATDASLRYTEAEVIGAVELYGRVVEHESGWRGEKARILAIAGLPPCEYLFTETTAEEREALQGGALPQSPRGQCLRWLSPQEAERAFANDYLGMIFFGSVRRHGKRADVSDTGRSYGVPVFGSEEGLEAFAREMGADPTP